MRQETSRKALDIYVIPGCLGCDRASQLAKDVRARSLPSIEVNLIDLSDPVVVRPEAVFAVPTYLLNGKVLSLGNPELEWLCQQVAP